MHLHFSPETPAAALKRGIATSWSRREGRVRRTQTRRIRSGQEVKVDTGAYRIALNLASYTYDSYLNYFSQYSFRSVLAGGRSVGVRSVGRYIVLAEASVRSPFSSSPACTSLHLPTRRPPPTPSRSTTSHSPHVSSTCVLNNATTHTADLRPRPDLLQRPS